ncbi:MAG: 50S ribosomal protein L4 [Candidatus Marinimicrobia bacterium]|nr:50S ribosomal protein L4 [Candidatus Neomarinimicrobiota bacterium]|tara:strand:+ start:16544 stop:17170 length:627 start_codon:yes stop_codon:yes gene_type:complete
MKVDIYNNKGKKLTKKIELDDKVFSIKPSDHSIYLTVKSELAAKRQGTSSSRTRAEVRGGGAKPWKQKGTGRARIGSTRNPSRVHGGSAFGPKPRDYNLKVNKKVRLLAKRSILSSKIKSNSYKIIDDFKMSSLKTKEFIQILESLKLRDEKLTMIIGNPSDSLLLSSRNVNNVNLVVADHMSAYDISNSKILLFDQSGIEILNEKLK